MTRSARLDLVREGIITFLSESLDKIAAFVAFVYFANYFTTGSFGTAYTVIGMSMIAGSVPKAIGMASSKRISENIETYERYFLFGVGSIVVYTAFVSAIVFAAIRITDTQFEFLALSGIAHLSGRPFLYHVERIYDGVGKTGAAASIDFFDGVVTSILRFVLILGFGLGPEGLLYSGAISGVVIGSVTYYWQFGPPTTLPSLEIAREIQSYTGWSLVTRLSNEVLHNSAHVLAGTLVSPSLASWIKSAQTLVEPSKITVRSVINSIFIQTSGNSERGELSVTPVQNGVDVASIIAIPILVGSVVLGDQLMVTAFGDGYAETGHILVAVAAAIAFEGQARVLTSVINGSDHPEAVAKTTLISAFSAVVVFSFLLSTGQIRLFLVGLITVYAGWTAGLYWVFGVTVLKRSQISWRFVAEQIVSAAVMGVVVSQSTSPSSVHSWADLILPIAAGGVAYFTLLLLISQRCRRIACRLLNRL